MAAINSRVAFHAGNEAAVGRALAQFGPGRAFLASKLSDRAHLSYDGAKARVAETLRFFGVETVDLYSLHSAFNFLNDAKARADLAGAWRALVELQKKGTLRALGVSNFNAVELGEFAKDPALGGLETFQHLDDTLGSARIN